MSQSSSEASPIPGDRVHGIGWPGQPRRGGARAGWALGLSIAGLALVVAAPPLGPWVALVGIVLTVLELISGNRGQRVIAATVLSGFSALFLGVVFGFAMLR